MAAESAMNGHAPDPQLEALVSAVNATRASHDAAVADLLRYIGCDQRDVPLASAPTSSAPPFPEPERRADLIGAEWVEVATAAQRFELSKEVIRSWCQRDKTFGWKYGAGWLVSVSKMRARLGIR
ncbi:hypothetical protein MPL3356_390150 [Mesorhizobium plurifarium]|uniref:Uncharacterized protein n=1 Tax=Mesorhizobium plurifarium TaxID=69974 RepID=A0A090FT59_MESPL|nr:hypothetical protein MPL3356_390150 [Mesorhizobium plurifarium]